MLMLVQLPTTAREVPRGLDEPRPGHRLHPGDLVDVAGPARAAAFGARAVRVDPEVVPRLVGEALASQERLAALIDPHLDRVPDEPTGERLRETRRLVDLARETLVDLRRRLEEPPPKVSKKGKSA